MISSIRTRILLITTVIVITALILTGGLTYSIVRSNTLQSINQNLDAISSGNTLAVDKWVAAKSQAVIAAAEAVAPGDPQGIVMHMKKADGFPITTVGWADKSFISSSNTTPPNYDPTGRPWYKAAIAAGHLTVTKPYGDAGSGVPYVSFAAPIMRDGAATGAVSGAVPLEGVREVVLAVHPTPSSLGFVVTKEGQILAHPDAKLILKPVSDIAAALTPALLETLVSATEPLEVDLNGAAKLLKAKAVSGTDWYLVVALDKSEATAGLRSVVRSSAIAIVLLALAAATLGAILTGRAFRRLSEVRDAMDEISSGGGDLTHRLPVIGNDEVDQISASFNLFVEKISSVLHEVRQGIDSMRVATDEIDMGNRDLSHRTETSAGNLQQTSAALTELTSAVRHSAQATVQATQLASSASEAASSGGAVVSGAVATMDEIARSSARISEIIGVIDSIAFQTNILALNAAVEAARAGENGRGFAVVATEVRNLAQRSATAALEIKGLIQASESNVKTGTERVHAAGNTMNEIVASIQRVNSIIAEINESMGEQSTGIAHIDQSVGELDQATQENAALVEESMAASSILNEQAHKLAATVAAFKLRENQPATHLRV